MQFSLVALAALAATVSANSNGTVVYTTEVHTAYTTVCPAATELTFNGHTYTATEVSSSTPTRRWTSAARWEWEAARSAPRSPVSSTILLDSILTRFIVHYLDYHQLPMHRRQASYHLQRRVLQHLVRAAI